MSRFAAIEARATQYPASANDVVWLVARVREMRDLLLEIKEDMGFDDGPHWDATVAALGALEEPNLPVD